MLLKAILPPSIQNISDKFTLWSRTDVARGVWAPSFERPVRYDTRGGVGFRAAHMRTLASNMLLSALLKAKLEVHFAALDVLVAKLGRGVLGDTLPLGVDVGESGGRLRWQKVLSAQVLPVYTEGPVGSAAVTETPLGAPLSPRLLGLLLTGAEAVKLEVVRGRCWRW